MKATIEERQSEKRAARAVLAFNRIARELDRLPLEQRGWILAALPERSMGAPLASVAHESMVEMARAAGAL